MNHLRTFFQRTRKALALHSLTTPMAIIIGACILGGSHIVYGLVAANGTSTPTTYFAGKPIDKTEHVEGTAKNDVYIVEYSDPECPFCISLHPTMKQLRAEFKDKVAFVYRHFPLTQIHPHAFDESKAIYCASKFGGTAGYYTYIDAVYGYKVANQTSQLPATGKEDLARNQGIDVATFNQCMQSEEANTAINASLSDGVQAGVEGTPSTFILRQTRKGYEIVAMIDGARQYDYFKAAVEEALAR